MEILRKESFGGILANPESGSLKLLEPHEYEKMESSIEHPLKRIDVTTPNRPLPHHFTASPLFLYLEVTKRCNGYCTQCYMDAGPHNTGRDEMLFFSIEKLIKEFSELGGYYIRLTGGEPTIRPDFFTIVDCMKHNGLRCGINSNGLFDDSVLRRIIDHAIRDIRISLEGPEQVNDALRGRGHFKKVYRNLELIREANQSLEIPVDLIINSVLMKSTLHSIRQTIEIALNFGARVSFGLLRPTGRADLNQMLTPDEVLSAAFEVQQVRTSLRLNREMIRINFDVFRDVPLGQGFRPFPFDFSRCPMATSGLFVDAYGQIFPCGYMVNLPEWAGEKVQTTDLLSLWYDSPVLNRARSSLRRNCRDCNDHKKTCNGGCPVMAHLFNGNLDGPDPYCVREAKKYTTVNIEDLNHG